MQGASVMILTSGNSLGAYVPGVRLMEKLEQVGIAASVEVLETLFTEEIRANVLKTKELFHRSFQAALMGHRLAKDIGPVFHTPNVEALITTWQEKRVSHFIAITGFWLPILELYQEKAPWPIEVEFLRLDAVDTPSYASYQERYAPYTHQWLFRLEDDRASLHMKLDMTDQPILSWQDRDPRIVVHGGGWGIGTYQQVIPTLQEHYPLDIVIYSSEERSHVKQQDAAFIVDPTWNPWTSLLRGEKADYPPTSCLNPHLGKEQLWQDRPIISQVIAHNIAIISKPGGGTLVDSLSGATPLIYLEPFGEHERRNAACWRDLGFGISYAEWEATAFDVDVLHQLHLNLREAIARIPNIEEVFVCNQKAAQH
ncbi:hypothetical protein [Paenibacillus sp. 1001270B_150601_E10]|uniref:hypothetical protein n=1 Tax=Paenibacillus sp. 1001270B_150601_E10 TaxID=2787079 RepID=UPI00189CB615|nr:hypothetical protein [Paenibacillus sp. 1001270B_150601_E10]